MTIELHPEYLTKNGKKEFVVLPYEELPIPARKSISGLIAKLG
ncbi:hypothetical protein ACE1CI_14425 [Aerosakkonemataceae cyanobacterium BLCC-F50]|uniref:Uncharacterized protein n=1 Tax=Floridaenema flaviceps BLCC-F50 TaxID=3153642 RepID=A0ABV4XRQ1_9CYAN